MKNVNNIAVKAITEVVQALKESANIDLMLVLEEVHTRAEDDWDEDNYLTCPNCEFEHCTDTTFEDENGVAGYECPECFHDVLVPDDE